VECFFDEHFATTCTKAKIRCPHFNCGHWTTREQLAQHCADAAEQHARAANAEIKDLSNKVWDLKKEIEATMVPFVKIVAGAEDIAKLWADGW